MTATIPTLTDAELSRCIIVDEDAGFGALTTVNGPLPLKAMDVQARIDGLLAEVALSQTFVNTFSEPLEATYIFPLPDRFAVTRFRLEVAGRVVEGTLKERGQARQEYDEAIQQGHRAAITEEERPGVFTMRVGNLPPGEAATVHLTLTGPLVFDSGEATFRFPLVVAPRYIPGTPLPGQQTGGGVAEDTDAVPDASRISPPVLLPGYPNPVRLSLSVEVEPSALGPREFRSSLHAVITEEQDRGKQVIRLQPGERLDRNFILRFRVGDERVRPALALVPDGPAAQEGTFVLTVVPPVGATQRMKPRDVVFVLDRSGSMDGWKMVAARRALARMVDTLTERDRFAVYAFDDVVEAPPELGMDLAASTDRNRFRAVEFLAKTDARNGTELAEPLDLAVKRLAESEAGRDRILVLITDGQVGNEDQILRALAKRLDGLRVFTLGIDQAVNEGFLRRLAMLGGGFCELVESEDRLDEVMRRLHSRLAPPVLRNLKLEAKGFRLETETVVPGQLPDLFPGATLLVSGRYRGAAEGSLQLSAEDMAGRKWSESVNGRRSDNGALTKTWARASLRELEDRYVVGPDDPESLERQIVETSLRFGVLCRFTAFVAVDRSAVVNEGGKLRGFVQPVELPAGWEDPSLRTPCAAAPSGPYAPAAYEEEMDYDDGGADTEELPASRVDRFALWKLDYNDGGADTEETNGGKAEPLSGYDEGTGLEETGEPVLVDLSAYRRRAAELAERIRAAFALGANDRVQELGILTTELAALVEDLKSVGAEAAVVTPLEKLQAELRQVLALDRPEGSEVERVLRRCEEDLARFAEVSSAGGSNRRASFWK